MHNPLPLLFHCPPLHALSVRIAMLATRRTHNSGARNTRRLAPKLIVAINRRSELATWILSAIGASAVYVHVTVIDRLIAIN